MTNMDHVLRSHSCRHRFDARSFSGSLRWFLILTPILLLAACPANDKQQPVSGAAAPVPVETTVAVQKDVVVRIKAMGQVEPLATVSVTSQVEGVVKEVHFREGQDVKQGDLLFTIDSRPYEASLREAESTLAKDRARLDDYRNDAKRSLYMLKRGFISRQENDKALTRVALQAATVKADEASVAKAVLDVGYCTIRSPIGGRTGAVEVTQGTMVRANDTRGLVVIRQFAPCYVSFTVPEKDMAEINRYAGDHKPSVEAAVPGDSKRGAFAGVLSFVDNKVDRGTSTVLLKAIFENGGKDLWPGQSVNVALTLTTIPDALVVPSRAVQAGSDGSFVFVVKADQTVEKRAVEARAVDDQTAVVEKGLKPGEIVVTDVQASLTPGARVVPKQKVPGAAEEKRPVDKTLSRTDS
jgi:membrane fusion protein, multidrug efflux system